MKIKPLPPLHSLIAFESAARNLSFTRAAEELSVTQGAVSRQVRQLEDFLGRALFVRDNRNIRITPAGLQYYQAVRPSLEGVAQATAQQLQWKSERQVTVATTNALASLWLLPKIPDFQRAHGDVDIRILASDQLYDLRHGEFDMALLYRPAPPLDMAATPLFPEEVFPVCSPAYLQASGALEHPEELFRKTLLYMGDYHQDWFDWPQWFQQVGLEVVEPRNRIDINNYPMLIQAAINGQGIALAWGHLVDDYLLSGALVRPVDTVLRSNAWFYLLEPMNQVRVKPSVTLFRKWLLDIVGDPD